MFRSTTIEDDPDIDNQPTPYLQHPQTQTNSPSVTTYSNSNSTNVPMQTLQTKQPQYNSSNLNHSYQPLTVHTDGGRFNVQNNEENEIPPTYDSISR